MTCVIQALSIEIFNDLLEVRIQTVDATQALNLSAGVS